jgi:ATP-binding cassette subfamily B protein
MSEQEKQQQSSRRGFGPGHGSQGPAEQAKDFRGTFVRLVRYIGKQRLAMLLVLIMAAAAAGFRIAGPKILGNATTELFNGITATIMGTGGIDFSAIGQILTTVAILYCISAVLSYGQQYIMASVSQRVVQRMRNEVKHKLSKLPLKYFDRHSTGDILSRVTNDIELIAQTLQQSVTQVVMSLTSIVGTVIMMFTISWQMTLIALLILPIAAIITQVIMKRSQKYFVDQQREIGIINGHIEEMYNGHNIIKAFGKEDESIEQFNEINDRLYDVGWKAQFFSGLIMPIMQFINNLGYVAITVVGTIFAIDGLISIGDIQAFIQYSQSFTQPIAQTAQIANTMQAAIAASERVFELLDEEEMVAEIAEPVEINDHQGAVSIEHVNFGYEENVPIIKDMNLDVKSGDVVAIVGPTGAGKTTLVNLLMRFYELDSGSIKVDGVDITDMSRADLRDSFGMVLQDTWLFNGSMKENIAYGNADATDEDIIKAAKMAHADHFIRALPDGYDTVLNEEASNISQGEKQLLTIARALLADPKILILDEATSSVDTRTEAYIQNAMVRLMSGRTNFVIAHRLSTIKNAEMILVMNHGEIIEQGNHEGLMAANGFYADLYNSQFLREEAV